jgi:hypothetical protein
MPPSPKQLVTITGRVGRVSASTMSIACPSHGSVIFAGRACEERQDLAVSMAVGFVALACGVILAMLFLYGEWMPRLVEWVDYHVSQVRVHVVIVLYPSFTRSAKSPDDPHTSDRSGLWVCDSTSEQRLVTVLDKAMKRMTRRAKGM